MPKFTKTAKELKTRFEKWMFIIRNLNKLDRIPDELREGIFEKVFEVAEIAKFSPEEVQAYEDSLKTYRDLKNSIDTAREEGKKEVALRMKAKGYSLDEIVDLTGLAREEIERLDKK